MCIESAMPSNRLILCRPLHLPPAIFPSIRVFPSESGVVFGLTPGDSEGTGKSGMLWSSRVVKSRTQLGDRTANALPASSARAPVPACMQLTPRLSFWKQDRGDGMRPPAMSRTVCDDAGHGAGPCRVRRTSDESRWCSGHPGDGAGW